MHVCLCVCVCVCGAKDTARTARKGSLGSRSSFGAFIVGLLVFDAVLGVTDGSSFLSCE